MKKIYTLIGILAVSTLAFSQQNSLYKFDGGKLKPATLKTIPTSGIKNKSTNTAGGTVSMRVDPMFNVFTNNSGTAGDFGTTIKGFYTELNCDSLVKFAYSAGPEFINTHMAGLVFDPQSISQGTGFTSLFNQYDAYTIDTLWFGGIYNRISTSSVVDTLVVDVAWSPDTLVSTSTLFYKYNPTTYPAFGSVISPKFAVANPAAHGLQARLSNPTASNYIRYKVPLNVSDTDVVNNVTGYLQYKLATPLAIPAGNRVAIAYTFKAGMAYSLGSIGFGDATNPQTVNAWAPIVYSQNPQATNAASTLNFFNDYNPGKNIGIAMYSTQRYGLIGTGFVQTTNLFNQFGSGYQIDISLHGNSSVGINDLQKNGFALGQNTPNPFTSGSTVKYELVKDASSAVFTVTDVMGRVISSEKVASSTGVHSVNLGSHAAGVYYYSLNVDGIVTTKKMIAQ